MRTTHDHAVQPHYQQDLSANPLDSSHQTSHWVGPELNTIVQSKFLSHISHSRKDLRLTSA